jgi:uncharacterized protein affecting Mg2+/Co2+ transport
LDSDTAWGQHRFAPSGAAYEQEALAALIPGGAELPVPPDALFPPATPPEGSGASPDFVPQRRYRAADLRRLVAANFRAPLLQAGASTATASVVPRMAQALAALRALPEQVVLERGSSASWHEGVLVEATARFMHATPPSSSGGGRLSAAIGGGAVPLALPPHVQAAAARLLGVAPPPAVGFGGGGSSGNEAEADDDGDEEEEEEQELADEDDERRARLRLARRRAADAARQHVFTYRVRVTNARPGQPPCSPPPRVQILGREWSIWGDDGDLKGLVPLSTANAVVGQQPVLPFASCFEYSSGTPLEAPRRAGAAFSGSMRGRLALAVREEGAGGGGAGGGRITATPLVVPIAEFRLVAPSADPRDEVWAGEEEEDQVEGRRRRGRRAQGQERWRWLVGR